MSRCIIGYVSAVAKVTKVKSIADSRGGKKEQKQQGARWFSSFTIKLEELIVGKTSLDKSNEVSVRR